MPAKKAKKVKTLEHLDAQIRQVQQALAALGPMRPGTLSRQYRRPQQRRGAYYQLSYTFQMRSHTEYVRPEELPQLRGELAEHRRYKQLTARWVGLSLRRAKLRIQEARGAGRLQNRPEGPPQAPSSGESWPLKSQKP